MKLSIILPIYNVEAYLEECVNSILMQSYRDYEIILVNDGSTDGSPKLCDDLAAKHDCIKVVHKKTEVRVMLVTLEQPRPQANTSFILIVMIL